MTLPNSNPPAEPNAEHQTQSNPSFKTHWLLDPAVTFLNHGSFGACPIPVLAEQRSLRDLLETEPLQFIDRDFEPLLDGAREALAQFVGARAADLVFVPNATTGINAVLRSLSFQPGDELLTTNHEYNASRNALDFVAERSGATVVVADIPFPITDAQIVIDSVLAKVTAQTRLLLIDHVTSQTGLILPIQPLIQTLAAQGIDTLVDGAHAPGMVPLNLARLGAAYYTGNCHKWMCAPKGAAFLYVQADRQAQIRPVVISHGANSPRRDRSRFQLEFDWVGTDDPTAYLCVATAIQFMESLLPGGWAALMEQNHQGAIAARQTLCNALSREIPCPDDMIGSMAVVPLPAGEAQPLQQQLWNQFQIEVPVFPWPHPPQRLIRVSAQFYNAQKDYDDLANALVELLAEP